MTVTNTTPRADYVGNGSVSAYDFDFPVAATSEIAVYVTDLAGDVSQLALTTGFTAELDADGSGTVTLVAGNLTSNYLLAIVPAASLNQQTDFSARSIVSPANTQTAVDRLNRQVQQVNAAATAAIRLSPAEDPADYTMTLPTVDLRASQSLIFDADGNVTAGAVTTATATVFGQSLIDDANAAAARTTLGMSSIGQSIATAADAAAERVLLGGVTISVDTVAAMTALTGNDRVGTIIVRGRTAKGDGGGGNFYWDSASAATANGGTIFASDAGGTGRFKRFSSEEIDIRWFGAKLDGTDDTSAVLSAVAAFPSGYIRIKLPAGVTKITSTITIDADRVSIVGEGVASRINFVPTANDILFLVDEGTNQSAQNAFEDFAIYSTDTTYEKTAIKLIDVSQCVVSNVQSISPHWSGGAGGSIFLHILGRQTSGVRDLDVYADRPIVISPIPAPHSASGIGIDHWNFHNCYLAGMAAFPIVELENGIILTQVSFTGYQAWVNGTGGLKWVDTTSAQASNGLALCNVRYEQATDATKYFLNIQTNAGLQGLTVNDGQAGLCRGMYLRNVLNVCLNGWWYTDSSREALNVDATVYPISINNCFWQTGGTATLTGQQELRSVEAYMSSPLPQTAYYLPSSLGDKNYAFNSTVSAAKQTVANDGVISLGAHCGLICVTISDGASALYFLNGSNNTVNEVSDPSGLFTPTATNAGTVNIYYSGGNSRYELENKRGGSRVVIVNKVGTANGF